MKTRTDVENGVLRPVPFLVRFFPETLATVPFLVTEPDYCDNTRNPPAKAKLITILFNHKEILSIHRIIYLQRGSVKQHALYVNQSPK